MRYTIDLVLFYAKVQLCDYGVDVLDCDKLKQIYTTCTHMCDLPEEVQSAFRHESDVLD